MKRHNFILTWLIAIFIALPVPPAFAQKTSKIGKKGKMIEFQPPKKLLVEVTVKGNGTFRCYEPGAKCTWSIDRKYSATINLSNSMKEPFDSMMSEPGTASAIVQAKVTAKAKANPGAAFNTKWYAISTNLQAGAFDVNVFINDERKKTWKQKTQGNSEEERSMTDTWTTKKTTGRSIMGAEVTLDRQRGAFRVLVSLYSEATMNHQINSSWEELKPLPTEVSVFDVPRIEGYVESEVIIPFDGDLPNEKNASFEKTFPNLKSEWPILGLGLPETKAATVTVTYKFK